jgi:GNAT superfamily N-acetyltransferase
MLTARQPRAAKTTSLAVTIKLQIADAADAADIAWLHAVADEELTCTFGPGPWSRGTSEKSVLFTMRNSTVYVARMQGRPIATLTLSTKKPWAIDKKYFSACERPLYLTSMAVAPDFQGQGIGRLCLEAAIKKARHWPADVIRLDAYDADAGAGEFYSKCGFREVGRAAYRGVPLIYFELSV